MAFRKSAIIFNVKVEETYTVRIYMSGPILVAKQVARKYCMELNQRDGTGLCVTVEPTTFIYTGGEEEGFVVGLLNYPRFPNSEENINQLAEELTGKLLDETCQWSALLVNPRTSMWITRRPENSR